MRMLCWPARSPRKTSSRLPGGTSRSFKVLARCRMRSLRLAGRSIPSNRRTLWSWKRVSVRWHRNDSITWQAYNASRPMANVSRPRAPGPAFQGGWHPVFQHPVFKAPCVSESSRTISRVVVRRKDAPGIFEMSGHSPNDVPDICRSPSARPQESLQALNSNIKKFCGTRHTTCSFPRGLDADRQLKTSSFQGDLQ